MPAEGCVAIDQVGFGDLEVTLASVDDRGNGGANGTSVGRVYPYLEMTRITELSGQRRSVVPPPPTQPTERGLVLGGREFVAFPELWWEGHQNPQALISAVFSLTLDGAAPIELPTRFIPGNQFFDQVAVNVPDRSGAGELAMAFVWADPCFRYEAEATVPVDVLPFSATAGCAFGFAAYYDQVDALLTGSMRVGSMQVRAFSPRNEAKFFTWGNPGIDASILYGFDPDAPAVIAAPGMPLVVEEASSDVTIGDEMRLSVWRRASVAKAVKDYPPRGAVLVLGRTSSKLRDGTFDLATPVNPGRYVAGVELTYDSKCSSGTLWFTVNVDVVDSVPSATPELSRSPS